MFKYKISHEDLIVLLQVLRETQHAKFLTHIEYKLCSIIIRDLIKKLMSKAIKEKDEYKLELSELEQLTLNEVLPQLPPMDTYSELVSRQLYTQINVSCLGIS